MLVTELILALGSCLLLLRRDQQRQLATQTLLHACGDKAARIILDSGGRIEVHLSAGSGQDKCAVEQAEGAEQPAAAPGRPT
jgi:hypothetical protein